MTDQEALDAAAALDTAEFAAEMAGQVLDVDALVARLVADNPSMTEEQALTAAMAHWMF